LGKALSEIVFLRILFVETGFFKIPNAQAVTITPTSARGPSGKGSGAKNSKAAGELNAAQQAAEEISVSSRSLNGPPAGAADSTTSETDTAFISPATSNAKKQSKLVPLEEYYYGFKPGDPEKIRTEFKCEELNTKVFSSPCLFFKDLHS